MMNSHRIGFLGAGKMASALAQGFLAQRCTAAAQLVASDVVSAARTQFQTLTGGQGVESNLAVLEQSDIVFLAVKPQVLRSVLTEIRPHLEPRHLVVSIAAGITLSTLLELLGSDRRVIRVMPNTPCLVGASASAFSRGGTATDADAELIRELLAAVGVVFEVPESLLDAVTGLSGSGPAFVYVMIEALADGGVRMGLPRDTALKLAAQTLLGSAKMVLETGEHPGVLKDAVASPGGTTIAGLHALERAGVRGGLMNAVEAATLRARELSRPAGT